MSKTTKPHRHHKALQDAASYIRQLFCESSYWTQVKTINGIRISMKPAVQPIRDLQSTSTTAAETSLLPTFRGDGVIKDITVQEVASVLRGFGARKLWDPRFERGKLLETLSDTENLVLSSQKGNLIVRSRDFVTANAYLLNDSATEALVVSTSVCDPLAPPEGFWGNYVRGEAKAIGWLLRQEGRNVAVTYIVQVDVKGQIPQSLIKLIQVQAPLCILNVSDTIKRNGTLPFVVLGLSQYSPSPQLQIKSEWVDPETNIVTVKFAAPAGQSNFSIAIPVKGKFAGGAIVEIGRHAGMCVKAEQIRSKTILTGIVGSNTACVLQLHISLMDGKEGTLVVKPYSDLQQRFSAVIVGATKDPVFVMNGERISEDVSSPVDSAIGFDNVVDSNQDLTKGSRQPALIDMALEIVDSTWETMIEMTANLVLSSYVYITSLLYGTPSLRATSISHQKSRYEQLDEDRIFEMVLEHVLNESDAF